MIAVTIVSTIAAGAMLASSLTGSQMYHSFLVHNILGSVLVGAVGWLLISAQPRNRAGWALVWASFFQGAGILGAAAVSLDLDRSVLDYGGGSSLIGLRPSDVSLTAAIGNNLESWTWIPGIAPMFTLALLWFPDGKLRSKKWRPVQWLSFVSLAVASAGFGWAYRPFGDFIYNEDAPLLGKIGFVGLGISGVLAIASTVSKYTHSNGTVRRQFRWIAWTTSLVAASWIIATSLDLLVHGHGGGPIFKATSLVSLPLYIAGFGIAIWKHQLFDIDVVISRTIIYASLLLTIGALYVGVVFGLGSLVNNREADSAVFPIATTVLIAVLFHPVRARLERTANRMIFGRRATPYEVLSDFAGRVAAADGHVLTTVAESIGAGTVASQASVWALQDGKASVISSWPGPHCQETVDPVPETCFPISHDGQLVGYLDLQLPVGEDLPVADQNLINDIMPGIGLALWNRAQTSDLIRGIASLRASRRRLVAVQDETRHRLERDLHDGAQQRLVALKVRLSIAQQMAAKNGHIATAAALESLCKKADASVQSLRAFARGVYPPLLQAEGLEAALSAQLARLEIDVRQTIDVRSRHPRDLESTVYFTVAETINSLCSEGGVHSLGVEVLERRSELVVQVWAERSRSADHDAVLLLNLARIENRANAVGGSITTVDDGAVTVVTGHFPAASLFPASDRQSVLT